MEIWDVYDKNGNKTGRTIERGKSLAEGDYHLVVHIWIHNQNGELLIQKRAAQLKIIPNIWATTGGSAIQGEDSKTAAMREVEEEIGIKVQQDKLIKYQRILRQNSLVDIWFLQQEVDEDDCQLQEEEVSEVKWVKIVELRSMIDDGTFYKYSYLEDVILHCLKGVKL